MSLHPPLYCTICSAPCLLPRADIPLPSFKHDSFPPSGDTTDSPPEPSSKPTISTLLAEARDANWQARWHVLKVTSGLCTTFSVSPSSSTLASVSEEQDPITQGRNGAGTRCVPIHEYCLQKVTQTIRKSMFNSGFSHEENMMLGWSIPKWTGYGPWVNVEDRGGKYLLTQMRERGWVGYWGGSVSQRERYQVDTPGSHLLPMDHITPVHIPPPKVSALPVLDRPKQTSKLLNLPSHILSQIAFEFLGNPPLDSASVEKVQSGKTKLASEETISQFLAFTRTCSQTRQLDLPSSLWRLLALHHAHHWKLAMLSRWRANPTGVGSASTLWISLDEDFATPLEKALSEVKYPFTEGNKDGYGARDVFQWWMYDPGWRSRRRIWHSVVHACATARDADWCVDEYSALGETGS